MSAKTNVAAAAIIMVFVAPTFGSAQTPHRRQQWPENATSSAYAAASKSSRTTRRDPSNRVPHATSLSDHVIGPDGRDLGTDPDPMIRFQLRRDPSVPGSGGGM
jgi:hypothetical protein